MTFSSPSCPIPWHWFHISPSLHTHIYRDVYLYIYPAVNAAGRRVDGFNTLINSVKKSDGSRSPYRDYSHSKGKLSHLLKIGNGLKPSGSADKS